MYDASQNDVVFGAFDPQAEVQFSSRNLPHWFQPGVVTFITFRTADSMPRQVIERWICKQHDWLTRRGLNTDCINNLRPLSHLPIPMQQEYRRLRDRLWHRSLDDCHGACVLRRSELAHIVADTLLHQLMPKKAAFFHRAGEKFGLAVSYFHAGNGGPNRCPH